MLSSPSDLMWRALAPLVQQFEAIHRVLEVCETYYAWCVGCAAGVALLLLGGLVVSEYTDNRGVPTATEHASNPTHGAWGGTLLTNVASRLENCADEDLDPLAVLPFESTSTES